MPGEIGKPPKWVMPEWMTKYVKHIGAQGQDEVEEWMNDHSNVQVNAPRALIACNVKGAVGVLLKLHKAGVIS
jgi:DNA-binding LacI/PurR family transcriptional regulator